jgi:hypothetical protein
LPPGLGCYGCRAIRCIRLALASLYLSIEFFLIDGLPFGNPPERMRGSMAAPLVILGLVGALIMVGLQWIFIFQSRFVTAVTSVVFAAEPGSSGGFRCAILRRTFCTTSM